MRTFSHLREHGILKLFTFSVDQFCLDLDPDSDTADQNQCETMRIHAAPDQQH
jgi:hypothetical protein